jgi:hypothetical protein
MADLQPVNTTTQPVAQQDTLGVGEAALAQRLHAQPEADPDLARVRAKWPSLPLHIKAAVLALVGTAG